MQTEIFAFDRGGEPLPETAALLLPLWRRERWERLRSDAARQESLAAGLLFARAMAARGLAPRETDRADVRPAGKPVLAERPDVWFSLSHSGRYVLCAVSGGPVGVDVQERRPVKLSIARRFHPGERDWLARWPEAEREAAFFRLWARKEAWVKAESDDRMLSLAEADVMHVLPGRYFRDYALPGGYTAAVCAAGPELPELTWVERDALLAGLPVL